MRQTRTSASQGRQSQRPSASRTTSLRRRARARRGRRRRGGGRGGGKAGQARRGGVGGEDRREEERNLTTRWHGETSALSVARCGSGRTSRTRGTGGRGVLVRRSGARGAARGGGARDREPPVRGLSPSLARSSPPPSSAPSLARSSSSPLPPCGSRLGLPRVQARWPPSPQRSTVGVRGTAWTRSCQLVAAIFGVGLRGSWPRIARAAPSRDRTPSPPPPPAQILGGPRPAQTDATPFASR